MLLWLAKYYGYKNARDPGLCLQRLGVWYITIKPIAGPLCGLFGWNVYCPSSKKQNRDDSCHVGGKYWWCYYRDLLNL
jgi:hypothetical protein